MERDLKEVEKVFNELAISISKVVEAFIKTFKAIVNWLVDTFKNAKNIKKYSKYLHYAKFCKRRRIRKKYGKLMVF